jgi:pimeloyl-ACP methyl ester carboxylesterase
LGATISTALAPETKVCAYDRAGRGGSDPASAAQDGVAVATDLHTLLDRAGVPAPFVLVGHSSGAQYVRIFAGRYPEQVAGMVLLDGQPAARSFQSLGDRPLVVVTATRDALAGWLPLQERMARLSTSSSHRLVPYTHDAFVTDRTAAGASTKAIRDVVYAARFATAVKKS